MMTVIGTDPHKQSFTFAAVVAASGELRSSETVGATTAAFDRALDWARGMGSERVWAVEDCRHVSGRFERFLVARGERVVRVPPKLMAGARRSARTRGKSDQVDALAVARAALREGVDTLPAAFLDQEALEIRLLLDRRQDLVADRTREQGRLRWHLHDLECEIVVPTGGLDRTKWLDRLAGWLRRQTQTARVRVARAVLNTIRAQTREAAALEREIALLAAAYNPQLLELPGCGSLTAAKLIAETAGAARFKTDSQFARAAGVAPIPVSSGKKDRWRLDRGGNRQLNCALHRIAVTAGRTDPETKAYLARKQAEGKSRMEALRCLKRHLARRTWHLMTAPNATANALDSTLALT